MLHFYRLFLYFFHFFSTFLFFIVIFFYRLLWRMTSLFYVFLVPFDFVYAPSILPLPFFHIYSLYFYYVIYVSFIFYTIFHIFIFLLFSLYFSVVISDNKDCYSWGGRGGAMLGQGGNSLING